MKQRAEAPLVNENAAKKLKLVSGDAVKATSDHTATSTTMTATKMTAPATNATTAAKLSALTFEWSGEWLPDDCDVYFSDGEEGKQSEQEGKDKVIPLSSESFESNKPSTAKLSVKAPVKLDHPRCMTKGFPLLRNFEAHTLFTVNVIKICGEYANILMETDFPHWASVALPIPRVMLSVPIVDKSPMPFQPMQPISLSTKTNSNDDDFDEFTVGTTLVMDMSGVPRNPREYEAVYLKARIGYSQDTPQRKKALIDNVDSIHLGSYITKYAAQYKTFDHIRANLKNPPSEMRECEVDSSLSDDDVLRLRFFDPLLSSEGWQFMTEIKKSVVTKARLEHKNLSGVRCKFNGRVFDKQYPSRIRGKFDYCFAAHTLTIHVDCTPLSPISRIASPPGSPPSYSMRFTLQLYRY